MASAKTNTAKRRQRAEEMHRTEQTRDRRNRIIAVTAGVAVIAGMVGGGWAIIASASDSEKDKPSASAPKAVVKGEKTFGDLSRTHVTKNVDYKQTPPVGGDHDAQWQNCNGDVYDKPLRDENAVHALEHGSVWVTYTDKASKTDIEALSAKVKNQPYTLMSPYPDQSGKITLTAWGHQLTVSSAKDPRVQRFFDTYRQGEQTPEPGAACTNGKATP